MVAEMTHHLQKVDLISWSFAIKQPYNKYFIRLEKKQKVPFLVVRLL